MFSWELENHKNFLLNMFNNKIPDKTFPDYNKAYSAKLESGFLKPYAESCPLTFITEALSLAIDLA